MSSPIIVLNVTHMHTYTYMVSYFEIKLNTNYGVLISLNVKVVNLVSDIKIALLMAIILN